MKGDWPVKFRHAVVVDSARVAAVLRRVAFDVEELARARGVEGLGTARVRDQPRVERRRRPAEPDLAHAKFCTRIGMPVQSIRQGTDTWTACRGERHRRGETDENPSTAYHPFRPGHH
ncbi:hypothetical protein [Streptomyces sp. NPDC013181]|uniref:hypothetical protein n=1 Tax=Streptomyces sp. NPDC013181 TaxID=3364864 RepID=UPI003693368B